MSKALRLREIEFLFRGPLPEPNHEEERMAAAVDDALVADFMGIDETVKCLCADSSTK